MTNYYVDPINGSDANNGTSTSTPKKTIVSLCATYTLTGGDEVRIAKDCTPTTLTETATFASPYTARHVTLSGACDVYDFLNVCVTGESLTYNSATKGTFTAASTVYTGSSTAGSTISQQTWTTPAATAINTKYLVVAPAAWNTTPINLSAYQEIWGIMTFNTTATVAVGSLRLCLCSDTLGDTIVDDLPIEVMGFNPGSTTRYHYFRALKAGGANLGASIKSVAIYTAGTSPGNSKAMTVCYGFMACKTNGKIKPLDFLWFDRTNRTGCFLANSVIMDGTTSAPRLFTIDTGGTKLPFFSNKEVQRVRPRYRKDGTDTDWTSTYSLVASALPYGSTSAHIKWRGGWNLTNDTQDGYTTFGNYITSLTYGLFGGTKSYGDSDASKLWYEFENFIVGSWSTVFYLSNAGAYIGHPYLWYTDCVVTGPSATLFDAFSGSGVAGATVVASEIWSPPNWTLGVWGTDKINPFVSMNAAATNLYIQKVTISNSCCSAYAVNGKYSGTYTPGDSLTVSDTTFIGGVVNDSTTACFSFWFFDNVVVSNAHLAAGTDVNTMINKYKYLDNITFTNNGYITLDNSTISSWIGSATNWTYEGEHDGTVRQVQFNSPTLSMGYMTGLVMNATNAVLSLEGQWVVEAPEIYGTSSLRLAGPTRANASQYKYVAPVVNNAIWNGNGAFYAGFGDWNNCSITAGTMYWGGEVCNLTNCTFTSYTGSVIYLSPSVTDDVLDVNGCTFDAVIIRGSTGARLKVRNCEWTNIGLGSGIHAHLAGAYCTSLEADNNVYPTTIAYDNASAYLQKGLFIERNINRTPGLHRMYQYNYVAACQTTIRHTPSGYAWNVGQMSSSTVYASVKPKWPLVKVAVKDGVPTTVSVWIYGYGILGADAGQLSATQPAYSVEINSPSSWQKANITFTPNASGVIEFYLQSGYGAGTIWDDVEVTI